VTLHLDDAVVCIVGLGYVGMPLAEAFSRSLRVIGFDIDSKKLGRLSQRQSGSRSSIAEPRITFTADPREINKADFIIICVPTPVTSSKEPDLSSVQNSAELVGSNMKRGSVVILESTVYPGVTETVLKPILEKESGLKCGADFAVGYSPERMNPGDKDHSIDKITKVVAGMDEATTDIITGLYQRVTPNVFKAKDIKTAEAAKVIENIQRDLNIALVNEFSIIFRKLGLNTREVLDAAATKWNFQRYSPGFVGGHCIPVDPYYLVHLAREVGYHPQVILAGRAINDYMPRYVAEITIEALNEVGKPVKGSRVLVLGLTYKEDVNDIRENPVKELLSALGEYGVEVLGFDPILDSGDIEGKFSIRILPGWEEVKQQKVDGIIIAVAHSALRSLGLAEIKEMQSHAPILIDVRGIFNAEEVKAAGICYKTM